MKVLRHNSLELDCVKRFETWNKFLNDNEKQSEQTSGRKWEVVFTGYSPICLVVQDWTKSGRGKLVYIYTNGRKVNDWRKTEVFEYKYKFFEDRGTSWSKSGWETEHPGEANK